MAPGLCTEWTSLKKKIIEKWFRSGNYFSFDSGFCKKKQKKNTQSEHEFQFKRNKVWGENVMLTWNTNNIVCQRKLYNITDDKGIFEAEKLELEPFVSLDSNINTRKIWGLLTISFSKLVFHISNALKTWTN